jgi:hypothetical protein
VDPFKNFSYGTVLTAPSPATSGTSLVLNSGQGALFPQPSTDGAFNVVIWPTAAQPTAATAEIARVTARSTDTLTITRTQEGFGPRTVVVGDQVMMGPTAKVFSDYKLLLRNQAWMPTGAISETFPRDNRGDAATVTSTGLLYLAGGLLIPANQVVTNVTFVSSSTAANTPTHWWFCLVDQALNVLAKTADQTTTAWAANTAKTLALTAPYTPTIDTPVYAGFLMTATTVISMVGSVTSAGGTGHTTLTPKLMGQSTSGLTTPASLGATAAAISAISDLPYAYLT